MPSVAYPVSLDSFQRKTNRAGTVPGTDTSFLYASGSANLGDYNDIEIAIEAIEQKVGVNNSAISSSIDYQLRSLNSVNPGHKHSSFWDTTGTVQLVLGDASGNVDVNSNLFGNGNNTGNTWGGVTQTHNPGVFAYASLGQNLHGMFLGHDNVAFSTCLTCTTNNPYVTVAYHNANNTPQMNQFGYGLRFQADIASIYWAIGTPGTPPSGAGTAPDWSNEPRLYLQPIVGGSGDASSRRMNLRAAHLRIGPQDSTVRYGYSGLFSALLVLERSADANDASILFKSFNPNQTYWAVESPGTQNLHVKMVTGTHSPYNETFTSAMWFKYNITPVPPLVSVGTDDGITPQGQLYVRQGTTGTIPLYVDSMLSPTVDLVRFANNGTMQFGFTNAGKLNFATAPTTTAAPGAGAAGALPATPAGYLTIQVAGIDKKIAYY